MSEANVTIKKEAAAPQLQASLSVYSYLCAVKPDGDLRDHARRAMHAGAVFAEAWIEERGAGAMTFSIEIPNRPGEPAARRVDGLGVALGVEIERIRKALDEAKAQSIECDWEAAGAALYRAHKATVSAMALSAELEGPGK